MAERAAPLPTSLSSKVKLLDHRAPRFLGAYRGEEVVAGALAASAGLSADTAVLYAVLGVLLTLLAAPTASLCASLQGSLSHLLVESRLPGEYLADGVADVGAVEVEPYAAGQHLYILLTEAGVGAGGAGLGTVDAGIDTGGQPSLSTSPRSAG